MGMLWRVQSYLIVGVKCGCPTNVIYFECIESIIKV